MLHGDWVVLAATPLAAAILLVPASRATRLVALVALAHVAILASHAFFPLPLDPDAIAAARAAQESGTGGDNLNLVPFGTIGPAVAGRAGPAARALVYLNLFVLAPAGLYLPILFRALRPWSRFAPVGIVVGASVEAIQALLSTLVGYRYRSIDIDDVILNTAGVFIAYAAFRLVPQAAPPSSGRSASQADRTAARGHSE